MYLHVAVKDGSSTGLVSSVCCLKTIRAFRLAVQGTYCHLHYLGVILHRQQSSEATCGTYRQTVIPFLDAVASLAPAPLREGIHRRRKIVYLKVYQRH